MESTLSVKFKRGGRRPRTNGGYSFLVKGDLPEDRSHILKYLMAVREGLTRDLQDSGKGLTTAQIILIDRITTKLGVVRCMEEYVREHSVFEGNELTNCLRTAYLAYLNSVRLDLQALGLDKRKPSEPDIMTVIAEIDRETKEAAEKRPVVPQDATSPEDSPLGATGDGGLS
jgi:hypothetical protein